MTEGSIFIMESLRFVMYDMVILIFLILALAVGSYAFCHCVPLLRQG